MIEVIQHHNKLNTFEVLDKYKILPKNERPFVLTPNHANCQVGFEN
jgi:hypothetical protein